MVSPNYLAVLEMIFDLHENYKVSEDSDLEYVKSIEQLCRDHKLEPEEKSLIYAVKNGAAILELDNDHPMAKLWAER